MRAKRFSAFCPSAIQGLPSGLGGHSGAETLTALADEIRTGLQMFFHGACSLLVCGWCFLGFFIITQRKPMSTLKVNNEIEILTQERILSSVAYQIRRAAKDAREYAARFFVDCG